MPYAHQRISTAAMHHVWQPCMLPKELIQVPHTLHGSLIMVTKCSSLFPQGTQHMYIAIRNCDTRKTLLQTPPKNRRVICNVFLSENLGRALARARAERGHKDRGPHDHRAT